jgi:hypothetical protein
MTAISAAELSAMRTIADDFFPDTCTIQTKTETIGATGGVSHSWANTYTGVACRLDPQGFGGEDVNRASLEGESDFILNIPYDQAIAIEDRIVHSSKTYEVTSVWDTHSYSTIRRAELRRVDSG